MTAYQIHGYNTRKDYLKSIANEMGIDVNTVYLTADLLGSSEDFDGLISTLQDLDYMPEGF